MIIIVCYGSSLIYIRNFLKCSFHHLHRFLFWISLVKYNMVRPIIATSSVNPNPSMEEPCVMMEHVEPYVHNVRQTHDQRRIVCPTDHEVNSLNHLFPSLLEVICFSSLLEVICFSSLNFWYYDLDWHCYINSMTRDIYLTKI